MFGMRLSAEENQSGRIPVDNTTEHAEYSFYGKKYLGVFSAAFSSALVQLSKCRIRTNVVGDSSCAHPVLVSLNL